MKTLEPTSRAIGVRKDQLIGIGFSGVFGDASYNGFGAAESSRPVTVSSWPRAIKPCCCRLVAYRVKPLLRFRVAAPARRDRNFLWDALAVAQLHRQDRRHQQQVDRVRADQRPIAYGQAI